ncbi:MAG: carboxypeptidase regulatory-like domain-containing protein [Gemmatimonadota bacterium]|nr:carboxypeptidase regulatory-like domain-containing protein [Gemmatimonadota bacterium]
MADGETTTDDSGQYSFTGLRAGTYSVEISSFDTNEVSFSSTSGAATVGVGESKVVSFDGTYLRTAGIQGQVTVDGEGLGGVTVTLVGEGDEQTDVTDAGGLYSFSKLKSGTYQIAITNPDPDDYEFAVTSKSQTIATGEVANVPFEGTLLRTAGIAGRVSVEGMGLDDVTVTLAGAEEREATTANGGQYSFAGLAAGTYVLTIANPNETAYSFDEAEMQKTVVLEDDQSAIVNFSGTHTRTASISGVLFIDEVMDDKMRNDGEPTITEALGPWLASLADDNPAKAAVAGLLASAKVTLRGPDLNTETDIAIMPDGSFTTGEALMAGSYQVELPANDDDVAAGLDMAGVAFVGESMVVTVEAGGSATADFPFRITKQTLTTAAHMGAGDVLGVAVPGVKLALFARADMTGDPLDEQTTDDMGRATFNFDRDANTGPAGNDDIVFVKVMESGNDALQVSGNEFVEIVYEATERISIADAQEVATLINVAVNFDFWVKTADTRDGNLGLGGWTVQYCMPMAKTDEADAVVCEGDDAAFMDLMMGEGDDAEPVKSDDGKEDMANLGKVSVSDMITDPKMLPATYYVRVKPAAVNEDGTPASNSGQPDEGEMWKQGNPLMHKHTGLDLPPEKTPDLMAHRITFTTQAIYVGTHRELDDRTGFTDFLGVGGGDDRPTGHAAGKIKVRLMFVNERGRLEQYVYDDDKKADTDNAPAVKTFGTGKTVKFPFVDASKEIVVVADAPSGMKIVPDTRSSTEIDAYGDGLKDFPDGVMVGAFGEGSGGRPDVWICPLSRLKTEDPNDHCSTFAYKWADGEISGKVAGLQEGDEDVVVILRPVRSNPDYSSSFADEVEIDYSAAGPTDYDFSDVEDGQYRVVLEGRAGGWEADSTAVINIVHDEGARGDDTDPGSAGYSVQKNLSATQLRYAIQGIVGNDRNTGGSLSRRETRAGVTLELYYASVAPARGTLAGKRKKIGSAIATAETNAAGVYEFTELRSDTTYVVKAISETGQYRIVRARGSLQELRKDFMYSEAVVKAAAYDPGFPANRPTTAIMPRWDHAMGKAVATGFQGADFVLLFEDTSADGIVSDPSLDSAHVDTEVRLHRCLTPPTLDANGEANDAADALTFRCGTLLESWPVTTVTVDESGDWFAEGLLEGYYEVSLVLPHGYVNSTDAGAQTGTNGTAGYFDSQVADGLTDGSRSGDRLSTFHIVNRRATTGTDAPTVRIRDGSLVLSSATRQYIAYDKAAVELRLTNTTASAGARLQVPIGDGTVFKDFTSGVASAWPVNPGDNGLSVNMKPATGYGAGTTHDLSGTHTIHRDYDTRMSSLQIDGDGASNPDDRVFTRSGLMAISGFVASEELDSDRINGVTGAQGANVNLGTISIDKNTATLTLTAEGIADGQTVSMTGVGTVSNTAGTAPTFSTNTVTFNDTAYTETMVVTITIADSTSGHAARNVRTYIITFAQPKVS